MEPASCVDSPVSCPLSFLNHPAQQSCVNSDFRVVTQLSLEVQMSKRIHYLSAGNPQTKSQGNLMVSHILREETIS